MHCASSSLKTLHDLRGFTNAGFATFITSLPVDSQVQTMTSQSMLSFASQLRSAEKKKVPNGYNYNI